MGIKNLNEYFIKKCSKQSIKQLHLRELWGKTIAIDTSIFIYRFLGNGALMKEMNQMLEMLQRYKIRPIFVFDGKSPVEKAELLKERRLQKREASEQLAQIEENQTAISKREFELLKKRAIRITYADLDNTRDLLDAYGMTHCRAVGEADKLCAQLVQKNIAWASMSDDMDLFLYDCPRVIRRLSLKYSQCSLYDTTAIFKEIDIDHEYFQQIMILTGTDYNRGIYSIEDAFEKYKEYIAQPIQNGFYEWLVETNAISKEDAEQFQNIRKLFEMGNQIESRSELILYDNIPKKNISRIRELLLLDNSR